MREVCNAVAGTPLKCYATSKLEDDVFMWYYNKK